MPEKDLISLLGSDDWLDNLLITLVDDAVLLELDDRGWRSFAPTSSASRRRPKWRRSSRQGGGGREAAAPTRGKMRGPAMNKDLISVLASSGWFDNLLVTIVDEETLLALN
jgi:hypothetical protein